MKELSIKEKTKRYDEAITDGTPVEDEKGTPVEDEKIRKEIISAINIYCSEYHRGTKVRNDMLAWLEKQGTPAKLSEEEQNRFAKGVLTSCALSFINYLDAHKYEGKMCVSNGECEDIENAFHNAMWDRLHRYYCKYIEKQGEKTNPYSGISFEYNGHIWGMCARDNGIDILLDKQLFTHLEKQGEQKPYGQRQECVDCQFNYAGECKGSCAMKRGEQNPADKIKPKFHEGDWVFIEEIKGYKEGPFQIKSLNEFGYGFDEFHVVPLEYEELLSEWSIQYAKDGDVLFTSSTASHETFIFKSIDEKGNAKCYFTYDSEDGFREGKYHFIGSATNCKPATKEQCDLLFQKMKEAGYEWDAEKKELRKIEQKPAWSEEDVLAIERIIVQCAQSTRNGKPKALYTDEILDNLVNWLKSLKDRVGCEVNCITTKELSEEDERMIDNIIFELEENQENISGVGYKIDWLKDLKDRAHPQNTWKPSAEQMDALEAAISSLQSTSLESLYNDLQKLKGE